MLRSLRPLRTDQLCGLLAPSLRVRGVPGLSKLGKERCSAISSCRSAARTSGARLLVSLETKERVLLRLLSTAEGRSTTNRIVDEWPAEIVAAQGRSHIA